MKKHTRCQTFSFIQKLEVEPETYNATPSDNWPNEGRIIFSKAEMKYRDNMKPVLRNITFDIHPQMKIGIVGRTGAGNNYILYYLLLD